jgi:hypothetical protein
MFFLTAFLKTKSGKNSASYIFQFHSSILISNSGYKKAEIDLLKAGEMLEQLRMKK